MYLKDMEHWCKLFERLIRQRGALSIDRFLQEHDVQASASLVAELHEIEHKYQQPQVEHEVPHHVDYPTECLPASSVTSTTGAYRLLDKLGEGGMGVVYLAEQTKPVSRQVALKIIKPGMDTKEVLARFAMERQALAMMDHPCIARVYDSGSTSNGHPYFVMELVKGIPITRYCDEKRMSLRERLELFVPVCQSVQHAHHKGIIHRDLKPSNVLVAEVDDRPVVKVIDFGLAKSMSQRLTENTDLTQMGQFVGTIDYMSPEQAKLNQLDIDTRSDIYSLGVLLYELIAGDTPFDRKRLHQAALHELLRIIGQEDPPRPSLRLSRHASLTTIAANRKINQRKLSHLLRGELDWIVMKALEKERSRRYETANSLAADVQRYLADEPVMACPPSPAYTLQKLVRRNRGAFMTGGLIVAALVCGLVSTTWQAVRATNAERLRDLALIDSIRTANPEAVPQLLQLLPKTPEVVQRLQQLWADESTSSTDRVRLALSLSPRDTTAKNFLQDRLLDADAREFPLIRDALRPPTQSLTASLWTTVKDSDKPLPQKLRAAAALAAYDPDHPSWQQVAPSIASAIVSQRQLTAAAWSDAFFPVRAHLLRAFLELAEDRGISPNTRLVATELLIAYSTDSSEPLQSAILAADSEQFKILIQGLATAVEGGFPLLRSHATAFATVGETRAQLDSEIERAANATVALIALDDADDAWAGLKRSSDPRLRYWIIDRLQHFPVDLRSLILRMRVEEDVGVKAALLLALGHCDDVELTRQLAPLVRELFINDPDVEVHAAARWWLSRRGEEGSIRYLTKSLRNKALSGADWFVDVDNATYVALGPVTFQVGSSEKEPHRRADEAQQSRFLVRRFAVQTTEVTVAEFQRFVKETGRRFDYSTTHSPGLDCPQNSVTWYDAAAFCNWQSELAGIPASEWCFRPNENGLYESGMIVQKNCVKKAGYRLPTEAEWEYACRAGSETSRFYGDSRELLPAFSWHLANSLDRSWPVATKLPNQFGLFDIYGNVWEWCLDPYDVSGKEATAVEAASDDVRVSNGESRVLRGGSFFYHYIYNRSALRNREPVDAKYFGIGFRMARTISEPTN